MRRSPLKRKSPLRSHPSEAFERRIARSLKQRPPKKRKPGSGELWRRDLGPCVICPAEGGVCAGPVQGHHAIEKQALKRRGLQLFLDDLRNRVPVCEHRHEQHTSRYRPIPRELLPEPVFEFAKELGLTWWVERNYPAFGGEAVFERRFGIRFEEVAR